MYELALDERIQPNPNKQYKHETYWGLDTYHQTLGHTNKTGIHQFHPLPEIVIDISDDTANSAAIFVPLMLLLFGPYRSRLLKSDFFDRIFQAGDPCAT